MECHTHSQSALESIWEHPPCLILLDLEMPEKSGYEICQELKSHPASQGIPIFFLTVESEAKSIQRALELGATDYLFKPFRREELLRRIRFRLGQSRQKPIIQKGNLTLRPAGFFAEIQTAYGTEKIDLTRGLLNLLELILRHSGEILTREMILDALSEAEGIADRSVDQQIRRLRKKLSPWDHEIRTVYGQGYQLVSK